MGVDPTKYYKIQLRRDTEANWSLGNPVLYSGELGLDTTYNTFKIGDGALVWDALPYANAVYPDDSLIAKLDEFLDPGFGIDMTYYSGEKVYEISTTGLATTGELALLDDRVDINTSGIAVLDDRMDDVEEDIEILDIKVSGIEARSSFDIEYVIRSPQGSEVYGDAPPPSACYVGLNGTVTTNPVTINEIFLSFIDKNGLAHNFVSVASGDTMNFREENSQAVAVRFRIDAATQLASGVKFDVTMQSSTASGTVDDGDIYDCLFFPDVDVSDKADIDYVDQLFGLSALKGSANTFTAKNYFEDHIVLKGDRRIVADFGERGHLFYGNDATNGSRLDWGATTVRIKSSLQLYHGKDTSGNDVTPDINCRGYEIKNVGKFGTTVDRSKHPSDDFNSFVLKGKTDAGEDKIILKDYHYKNSSNSNSMVQYLGRTDNVSSIQTKSSVETLINTALAGFTPGSSLPNGGNTGYVLKKASNADGDAEWTNNIKGLGVVSDSTSYTSGSFYKSGSTLYWVP